MQSFILDFEPLLLLVPTSLPCTIFSALPFSQCVPSRMNLLFCFSHCQNSLLILGFTDVSLCLGHSTSHFTLAIPFPSFQSQLDWHVLKEAPVSKSKSCPLLCHQVAFSTFPFWHLKYNPLIYLIQQIVIEHQRSKHSLIYWRF